jgi:hypothetical protein
MNSIIGFFVLCLTLALAVGIGWFMLQVGFTLLALLIGGIWTAVAWAWEKVADGSLSRLLKRSFPPPPWEK